MNKGLFMPLDLHFFDEGTQGEQTPPAAPGKPDPAKPDTAPPTNPPKPEQPVNYEELFATDKALQSFVDKTVTKATQTAVANALEKAERANNEKLTRAERLQAMSDADKIKFLEKENKELQNKWERDKEIESLKSQTAGMLTESKIPPFFLEIFDFDIATAEDIKKRVGMLAEYEYYPKGELEKQITAGVNDKLKQKTPETRGTSDGSPPPKMPQFF
jgi:hypothetical protein